MTRRFRKFIALQPRYQWVLLRAWFMLGWYRASIRLGSFKRLTRGLHHHANTVCPAPVSEEQLLDALRMGRLVAAAARLTPWQSPCLTQVLVVQRLLAGHDIPGQFFLGVRRGCEITDDPAGLSAHAWVQCGEVIVNGGAGHEQFTVLSAFSWGLAQASRSSEAHA